MKAAEPPIHRISKPPQVNHRGRVLAAGLVLAALAVSSAGAAAVLGYLPLSRPAPPRAEPPVVPASVTPADLQAELDSLADAYGEEVGLAVMDAQEGWLVGVEAGRPFPQQSVSKLWVALALLGDVDAGTRTLDQTVTMSPADRSVFAQRQLSGRLTLGELLRLAIVESDNAANDKLIRELGGAQAISETLWRRDLAALRVGGQERDLQSQIAGLEWREAYGYGRAFKQDRARLAPEVRAAALEEYLADPADGASPAAIVGALVLLRQGKLLSPASTQTLLTLMSEVRTGPNRLRGGLPQAWSAAHKTGTGQDFAGGSIGINDVGLLTAPDGRVYAVAVMIRRTHKSIPERLAFMQAVSGAVADYWAAGPGRGWTAPPSDPAAAGDVGAQGGDAGGV